MGRGLLIAILAGLGACSHENLDATPPARTAAAAARATGTGAGTGTATGSGTGATSGTGTGGVATGTGTGGTGTGAATGTGTGDIPHTEFPTWSYQVRALVAEYCADCHASPACDDSTAQSCFGDGYAQALQPPRAAICGTLATRAECFVPQLQAMHPCVPSAPDCLTPPNFAAIVAWTGSGLTE